MTDDGVRAQYGSASRLWSTVAAVLLVFIGAIGAWRAAVTGADFMYDLEQARSALARTEPVIVDPHTPKLADHVVLVIVDGLRFDASRKMRYLSTLRAAGVDAHARSHYPTWSRPNYVSILTGVPPQASGVRTNRHYTPVALDSLMDRTRAAGMQSASAAEASPLPALFLRPVDPSQLAEVDRVDIDGMMEAAEDEELPPMPELELRTPFDDGRYTPWPGGLVDALRAQLAVGHELEVVLLSMVDAAGHAEGADSDEYRAAVQVADRTLARVLPSIDLTRDTIIITADHGHTDPGGHGGVEPEVLDVPLVMIGAGVKAGALPRDARLIDLAPTVSALLGIPAPGHGLGRTLTELLTMAPDHAAAREAADATRLMATERVVRESREQTLLGELRHRGRRLFVVAVVGAALVGLAFWLYRRRGVRFSWKSAALGVPAFFVVYYAMIAALGRFSPSFLPERGHMALELAKYGLIGVAAHVAVGWFVLRRRHDLTDRLALANGNAIVGLGLTMVPASLTWAFFPPPYVEVPGPRLLVLLPAVQVALALYAIAILLALIVEVVVFFSRALDPRVRLKRLERATARIRAKLDADGRGITIVPADGPAPGSAKRTRRAPSEPPVAQEGSK